MSSVLFVNANGLRSKMARFLDTIRLLAPIVACVCEVKALANSVLLNSVRSALATYRVTYFPGRARAGGVLILTKLCGEVRLLYSGDGEDTSQVVSAMLRMPDGRMLRVVAVYRNPASKSWNNIWSAIRGCVNPL